MPLLSKIDSVTVFREGAEVSRSCPIPKGEGALKMGGLPLALLDGTVQISLRGAPVDSVPLDYRIGLETDQGEAPPSLSEQLREALLAKELLAVEVESIRRIRKALEEARAPERPAGGEGQPPPPQQTAEHLKLLTFRRKQLESLNEQLREKSQQLEKAEEELARLRHQERSQAREIRPEELRKVALVTLNQPLEAEGAELVLTYRVRAARWAPAYSVRFSSQLTAAELTMRAVVAQASGEDWSQVSMRLSTANPSEWRELPELMSKKVGRRESPKKSSWRPPPLGTQELYRFYDVARQGLVAPPPPPPPPRAAPAPVMSAPPPPQARMATGALMDVVAQSSQLEADEVDDSWCEGESKEGWLGAGGGAEMQRSVVLGAAKVASAPAGGLFDSRRRLDKKKSKSRSAGALLKAEATETVLTLDQKFRQYSQLRMPGPREHRRGELIWVAEQTVYQESLTVEQRVVTAAFEAVGAGELRFRSLTPPRGHSFPTDQGGFDSLFEATGKVDVACDGQFHSLPVWVREFSPEVRYLTVPRQEASVFRSAQIENSTEQALPEGPADVFVGGDFLHTTPLRDVGPGGVIRLGLGVSESVQVSRRATFKEGTSGLMGGTASLAHCIIVEAANNLKVPITLEVLERLPEPADDQGDDIKIEVGKVQPGWEKYKPDYDPQMKTGYRWLLRLDPGQKREASAHYTISFSSKYELAGGNRREPSA